MSSDLLTILKQHTGRDSVSDSLVTASFRGVPVCIYKEQGMGRHAATTLANKISSYKQYNATILDNGGSGVTDYIVIIMKHSDEAKLGLLAGGLHIDNSAAMQRLKNIYGKPLTYINNVPALIESESDFGEFLARPIVLVSVGGKKIPFYVSTGSSGKTDVVTGKWEFFCGIDEKRWFRKGTLNEILSHYNSPELKQIATALDEKIGDVRDTIDVKLTVGRECLGGKGMVGHLIYAPMLKPERINQSVFNPKNKGWFEYDLCDIKQYLQDVHPGMTTTKDTQQGINNLKNKLFSRVVEFFKRDRSDW